MINVYKRWKIGNIGYIVGHQQLKWQHFGNTIGNNRQQPKLGLPLGKRAKIAGNEVQKRRSAACRLAVSARIRRGSRTGTSSDGRLILDDDALLAKLHAPVGP